MFLALHGNQKVVGVLLRRGNYPSDVTDSCGSTPLMDALRSGYTDIADTLASQFKVAAYDVVYAF